MQCAVGRHRVVADRSKTSCSIAVPIVKWAFIPHFPISLNNVRYRKMVTDIGKSNHRYRYIELPIYRKITTDFGKLFLFTDIGKSFIFWCRKRLNDVDYSKWFTNIRKWFTPIGNSIDRYWGLEFPIELRISGNKLIYRYQKITWITDISQSNDWLISVNRFSDIGNSKHRYRKIQNKCSFDTPSIFQRFQGGHVDDLVARIFCLLQLKPPCDQTAHREAFGGRRRGLLGLSRIEVVETPPVQFLVPEHSPNWCRPVFKQIWTLLWPYTYPPETDRQSIFHRLLTEPDQSPIAPQLDDPDICNLRQISLKRSPNIQFKFCFQHSTFALDFVTWLKHIIFLHIIRLPIQRYRSLSKTIRNRVSIILFS